jgi:hypothetical protein
VATWLFGPVCWNQLVPPHSTPHETDVMDRTLPAASRCSKIKARCRHDFELRIIILLATTIFHSSPQPP